MEYQKQEIKPGITLHQIQTNKFKTNLLAVFFSTPLTRENVTKNALIPAILRRGSKSLQTQEEISKELEKMYGASFNCGIEKSGDNQTIKFYLEGLNNQFLPEEENLLEKSIQVLLDIVFNPVIEKEKFKEEYIESEKKNLKQIIEGKKDNKAQYAINRCVEEMYKNKPYGLYKYGYIEDLETIDASNLYKYYLELIQNCKIDIFVSGDIQQDVIQILQQNENIQKLNKREAKFIKDNEQESIDKEKIDTIEEKMDVAQGKLVIGFQIEEKTQESKYVALVYNAILGGTPTSKLFQNVREKASLAYTASSSYIKQKQALFINCGIEIQNYEKALEIIKQQLEDMKQGNFTNDEFESAKTNIISTIEFIPDEQDTQITYYLGQELAQTHNNCEQYIQKIQNVTKEQVKELAKKVSMKTIYFLCSEKS